MPQVLIQGFTYTGSATYKGPVVNALGGPINIYAVAENKALGPVVGAWGGATVVIEQCYRYDPTDTLDTYNVWIPLTKFVNVGTAGQGIGNATYTQNEESWCFAPGGSVAYRARISGATDNTTNLWVYSA